MREISVSLAAIRHNYRELKDLVAPAKVMAVVKANAYGHGMIEVAKALEQEGVDMIGVADLTEAIALRQAGITASVMCWLLDSDDNLDLAAANDVTLGISTMQQLETVPSTVSIHIKVDTGLGRNGFMPEALDQVIEHINGNSLKVSGVFSHLANTSEVEDKKQARVFDEVLAKFEAAGVALQYRHLAASAGALNYANLRYDMVRCGLAIYGLNPFEDKQIEGVNLVPAMKVASKVVNLKRVPAGQGVSYGYRFVSAKETTLALIPFGYAEGMPRVSEGAKVKIGNALYPVVGRVAMDQFVVDVADAKIQLGDEVVIFGDASRGEPTAEALGASSGSINYEIVTRIGGRANRVYSEA